MRTTNRSFTSYTARLTWLCEFCQFLLDHSPEYRAEHIRNRLNKLEKALEKHYFDKRIIQLQLGIV
jgi:hypothetical protein